MTRRRLLAYGLVVALVSLAGCSTAFGPGVQRSAANTSYDWRTPGVNASITVTGGSYKAVYDVSNQSTFVVYKRDGLGRNQPLSVSALKFRYPNGTVVTTSSPGFNVTTERDRTVINLPARNGTVAFIAPTDSNRFATRTFVEGNYSVTLPAGMRVKYVPLAKVSPSPYETHMTESGRVRITWTNVESNAVVVRYYLERDLYIFAAGIAVLVVVALAGVLYYLRQIRELERRRENVGPDVDTGDSNDGPGF